LNYHRTPSRKASECKHVSINFNGYSLPLEVPTKSWTKWGTTTANGKLVYQIDLFRSIRSPIIDFNQEMFRIT